MDHFDDILFADRNRAYGAYDLRQGYRSTLWRAAGLGTLLFAGTLQLPTLYGLVKPESDQVMIETTLERVVTEAPPDEKVVVRPKPEPAPTVATVRNLVPEVVTEAPDEAPPVATVDELKMATSGPTTQEGTDEAELILAPEAAAGPTAIERAIETPEPKPEAIFTRVEQMPDFPGGTSALRDYLQRTLKYPTAASQAGVSGKVYVNFTVNTDGNLTSIEVVKGIGYGCDEEAARVVKAMPRWRAGRQSGRAVRVKFVLPITFMLE